MDQVKGYKGFNADMTCRNFQFESGKVFEMEELPVICGRGFHFCQSALDVFDYYPPVSGTRYFEVIALGKVRTEDNKSATNKIKIGAEISIKDMYAHHFAEIEATAGYRAHANTAGCEAHANTAGYEAHANTAGCEAHANTAGCEAHANTAGYRAHANTAGCEAHANTAGYRAHANTAGYRAHANTAGYRAHANTAGYRAHANTAGDRAHANTAGDEAHANTAGCEACANTAGDRAIAAAIGIQSKAKTSKGWIVITDWQVVDGEWAIKGIHSSPVGGRINEIEIKANTWYWFEGGSLNQEPA